MSAPPGAVRDYDIRVDLHEVVLHHVDGSETHLDLEEVVADYIDSHTDGHAEDYEEDEQ